MELGDNSYSLNIIDEIIFYYVQEAVAINPLEEYLGGLTNDEGEVGQVSSSDHLNGQPAPPKGKKNEHEDGPPWKEVWKKLGEKKKNGGPISPRTSFHGSGELDVFG